MSQVQTVFTEHVILYWSVSLPLLLLDRIFPSIKAEKPIFPVSFFKTVKIVSTNQLLSLLCLFLTPSFSEGGFFVLENLYKIPIAFLALEILFFYSHCLLHTSYFWKIHSVHHTWAVPSAISALYAHPIEHVLSNLVPILLSAKFSGLNFDTARVWHVFVLLNTLINAHGSYKTSRFHLLHHIHKNCNFGALGLLDYLHKTTYIPNTC